MSELPLDDSYKPSIGGYDPTGHRVVALEAVSVTTDTSNNVVYGNLNATATIQAVTGTSLAADVSNTELRTSLYAKNAAAGDTALTITSGGSLHTTVDNGNANGQATMANSAPVVIASNQSNVPIITDIANRVINAQAFHATTGKISDTTAKVLPFSIFNPSASGKSILIYSIRYTWNGATNSSEVRVNTVDPGPGYTGAAQITPLNAKAGGPASVASCYYTDTSTAAAGTAFDFITSASSISTEVFTNGEMYLLPAGTANGIVLFLATTANSGAWCVSAKWLEF